MAPMPLDELQTVGENRQVNAFQRLFLAQLASVIQSTPAAELDRQRVTARVIGKRAPTVYITLPHRMDPRQRVEVFIEPDAVVFSYDRDHLHFGYGEPDPAVEEALDFTRDLLNGRIEVEVRGWLVGASVVTHRRAADGGQETLQRGGYLGLIGVPFRRTTRRISFQ